MKKKKIIIRKNKQTKNAQTHTTKPHGNRSGSDVTFDSSTTEAEDLPLVKFMCLHLLPCLVRVTTGDSVWIQTQMYIIYVCLLTANTVVLLLLLLFCLLVCVCLFCCCCFVVVVVCVCVGGGGGGGG